MILLAALLAPYVAFACSALNSGPRKVVLTETVCNSVRFLTLKLGETNRIVLDNDRHTPEQITLQLRLPDVPIAVIGEVPENSTIGDPRSTILLSVPAGESDSVDVEPRFTGQFDAACVVTLRAPEGLRIIELPITFQFVEN